MSSISGCVDCLFDHFPDGIVIGQQNVCASSRCVIGYMVGGDAETLDAVAIREDRRGNINELYHIAQTHIRLYAVR